MHASREHGGSVVEAVPEVEYKRYEHGFIWNPVAIQRQVRVRVRVLSGADVLELLAGERGEFAAEHLGCQTPEGHTHHRADNRPQYMVVVLLQRVYYFSECDSSWLCICRLCFARVTSVFIRKCLDEWRLVAVGVGSFSACSADIKVKTCFWYYIKRCPLLSRLYTVNLTNVRPSLHSFSFILPPPTFIHLSLSHLCHSRSHKQHTTKSTIFHDQMKTSDCFY